jgi:hypothetical protein
MQAGEAEASGGQKHAAIERSANRGMARVHDDPSPDTMLPNLPESSHVSVGGVKHFEGAFVSVHRAWVSP